MAVVMALLSSGAAWAARGEDSFYRGKVVTVLVGYSPGGGYDLYARTLARHLGRHIPGNPTVIVQNMPGAGSKVAANYLYNVAPKDGTVFGIFAPTLLLEQIVGAPGVQYDASKFSWVGSMSAQTYVALVRGDAPVTRFGDVFRKPLRVGSTGGASLDHVVPSLSNELLGTRFDIIAGYPGSNEVNLAIERGEVHGKFGDWASLRRIIAGWGQEGIPAAAVLVQLGLDKHPELPNVPLIWEFINNDRARRVFRAIAAPLSMGRPFAAPPGVPAERLAMLRKAFMDTLNDPQFRQEARTADLDLANPMGGQDVQQLVGEVLRLGPEEVAILSRALKTQ